MGINPSCYHIGILLFAVLTTVWAPAGEVDFQVTGGTTVIREEGYRSLAGLPSYDLARGLDLAMDSDGSDRPEWLCLTISRDVREDNAIALFASGEKLREHRADFVSAGQRLRIHLTEADWNRVVAAGSLRLEASTRLWIVAPNEAYPRLGPALLDETVETDPLARLRDSAITQFGWMHGCVLDGLYDLYKATGDGAYREALDNQLDAYLTEAAVDYESPRNHVAINTFESIELTLPFAVIAKLHPAHPAIDAALDYLASRTDENGLITDGWSTTAEGCYTIAYPLMVIGRLRDDEALRQSALEQLRFRKAALWVDSSIYLRKNPEGRHSFRHWARGVCWYFLGTVRTLLACGEEPSEADKLHLQELAAYVSQWQGKDGLWRNFMDDPEQLVDTSGSSGIAAALALAARRGWIDSCYLDRAQAARAGLQAHFVDGGFLASVAPNNKRGEKEQRANKRTCEPFALGLYGQLVAALALPDMKPINHIATSEKVVALTFDDGPHETNTLKYIELFAEQGVKATFFETGKSIASNPGLLEQLVAAGHEIGNHSISHPHFPKLESMDAVRKQIAGNQERISGECGVSPKVFRAPYLEYDERVFSVLHELGLSAINASRSVRDWSEEATVAVVLDRATRDIQPGDILLMHTWAPNTLEAMPEIIRRLREQGFRFVTVSELLAIQD